MSFSFGYDDYGRCEPYDFPGFDDEYDYEFADDFDFEEDLEV